MHYYINLNYLKMTRNVLSLNPNGGTQYSYYTWKWPYEFHYQCLIFGLFIFLFTWISSQDKTSIFIVLPLVIIITYLWVYDCDEKISRREREKQRSEIQNAVQAGLIPPQTLPQLESPAQLEEREKFDRNFGWFKFLVVFPLFMYLSYDRRGSFAGLYSVIFALSFMGLIYQGVILYYQYKK